MVCVIGPGRYVSYYDRSGPHCAREKTQNKKMVPVIIVLPGSDRTEKVVQKDFGVICVWEKWYRTFSYTPVCLYRKPSGKTLCVSRGSMRGTKEGAFMKRCQHRKKTLYCREKMCDRKVFGGAGSGYN